MAEVNLVDLEGAIKRVPGVLGCVILTGPDGGASEIQAFTRSGTDTSTVQEAIRDEVARQGLDAVRRILVFELEAESLFGDRESLERAVELAEQEARARGARLDDLSLAEEVRPAPLRQQLRPTLSRVVLSSSASTSEATVALLAEQGEVVGESSGEKTPHGLKVLAQATLDAAARLTGGGDFTLRGASLVSVVGEQAVLVIVHLEDGRDVVGAALVRGGPLNEAAVRATLDAINRRLTLSP